MTGEAWIALAIERAESAVHQLRYAQHVSGPTGDVLRFAYAQLRDAGEALRDAGDLLGTGDIA